MREPADLDRLLRFMAELGGRCHGPGSVYFAGGATALLVGWRNSTADLDIKLEPEPAGAFEAIAHLKDELDVNIELAAPDQFIPPVPGWTERSQFVAQHGDVRFLHYDFTAQALSKIARGSDRDLSDVNAMLDRKLVNAPGLRAAFEEIRSSLVRYPRLDEATFAAALERALAGSPKR